MKPTKLAAKEANDYVDTDQPLDKHIQEKLLALLCYDEEYGAKVATIVSADTFDGMHHRVAKAVFKYRRQYGQPPKDDTKQIIDWLTLSAEQRKTADTVFANIIEEKNSKFNKQFTLDGAKVFKLNQQAKLGLDQATELYLSRRGSILDVLNIMAKASRIPPQHDIAGIELSNFEQSTQYLERDLSGLLLGLRPFDRHGLRLKPGTLTLYMGAKNSGKSWFCTHVARKCSLQSVNVLHVTLEMSEREVAKRYHQSFCGLAERATKYTQAKLRYNDRKLVSGWEVAEYHTKDLKNEFDNLPMLQGMTLAHPKYKEHIERQHNVWKKVWQSIRIVEFPTGQLTIEQLEAYLDFLNNSEGWQPHVVIVDYPDLMKINTKDFRLDLGEIVKDLRGIAIQRKLAMVTPTQINREGMDSKELRGTHVAEDVSKLHTADTVLTYQQTKTEFMAGLARLNLLYARDCARDFEVVLAQNYTLGQYAVNAHRLAAGYKAQAFDKPQQEGFNFKPGKK